MPRTTRLALLLFVVIGVSSVAGAQTLLECAADTHLSRHGTYLNCGTGTPDANVHEWEIGSGCTYSNVQGISAEGLLSAYDVTGNAAYLSAAVGTANTVMSRYNAAPTLRPYAQDVSFFAHLCDSSGDSSWCTLATSLYARVINDFPTGTQNADRYIDVRKSLSGWDVAAHIRAASLTGYQAYADEMADRLFARRPDWEHVLYGGFDYTELSHAGMLWAYTMHSSAGDPELTTLHDLVLSTQLKEGSWSNDPQTTAYAVIGLIKWGDEGIWEAVGFLAETATSSPSCGWGVPEYGEVNSEVIMALSTVYPTGPEEARERRALESPPRPAIIPMR